MGNKTLTLSVVIPTYNEQDYIGGCLDSIAAQVERPEEVIVVDNNSSDNTRKIARQYSFVRVIKQPKQGVRFARNTGFDAAKSDLIGRIDADTRLAKDWATNAKQLFGARPSVDAATGPCSYYDMPLERIGLSFDKTVRKSVFMLGEMPLLYGSNMVVRRKSWTNVRDDLCMSGEMYEDHDLSIHLMENGHKIVYEASLVAGVSARRLDDRPRDFARNMKLHTHTFAVHGMKNRIATVSRISYLSIYPSMKLIRTFYDPDAGRLSIKKALYKKALARPDSRNY